MSQNDGLVPLSVHELKLCIKYKRWVTYIYSDGRCYVSILGVGPAAGSVGENIAFRIQGEKRVCGVDVYKDGSSVVTDRKMFFLLESILADIKAQELEPHPERKPELQPNEVGKRPIGVGELILAKRTATPVFYKAASGALVQADVTSGTYGLTPGAPCRVAGIMMDGRPFNRYIRHDGKSVSGGEQLFYEMPSHPLKHREKSLVELGKEELRRQIKPVTFNIQSVAKKVQPPQHERLEAHPVDFCGDGDQSRISGPVGLITEQENWDRWAQPMYQVKAYCPHCGSIKGCMCPRE